jgi:hypothetical protein
MSRRATNKVVVTNLLNHPAVLAWQEINPYRVEPVAIVILKEQRAKGHKSAIYRLEGVGPAGANVIAKRSRRKGALLERTIYEEFLPLLPVPTLLYYGFFEEPDSEFCWLFLEDARGEAFSSCNQQHRTLAARWLGAMHTCGVDHADIASLPNRGQRYYLEQLRSGSTTILQSLDNPRLKSDHIAILRNILTQYELLESCWGEIGLLCDNIPKTLVHGDFIAKNIFVRSNEGSFDVLPFDWEMAGWGEPAADLAQTPQSLRGLAANPDITVYAATVRDFWPEVELQTLKRLAKFGTLCRLVAAIAWAAPGLATNWVQRSVRYMHLYESHLSDIIRSVELGS